VALGGVDDKSDLQVFSMAPGRSRTSARRFEVHSGRLRRAATNCNSLQTSGFDTATNCTLMQRMEPIVYAQLYAHSAH
jgi:hypothetical protein